MNTEQFLQYLLNNQDYLQDDPITGLEFALETYKNYSYEHDNYKHYDSSKVYYLLTVVNPNTGKRFILEFHTLEDLGKVYQMLCDLAK